MLWMARNLVVVIAECTLIIGPFQLADVSAPDPRPMVQKCDAVGKIAILERRTILRENPQKSRP
jgi:hypothetical protein